MLVVYGAGGSNLRGCNRAIFPPAANQTRPHWDGCSHGHHPGSASSADRWSLWRPGWGTDQCVEVKIPVFFRCTGKPSSADVTSVVYARQRHPRTARLQLNDLTGLERLCHDLILANVTLCPSSYGAATGAKKRYGALPPSSLSAMHLQRVRTRDA